MKTIAAADRNWAIGKDGHLLVHISPDLKNFRKETEGKIVILGRKTLATFPGGRPLKNRINIILSRNPDYTVDGGYVVHSKEELQELLETEFPQYRGDDVVVIGGESIYRHLLPLCDTAVITRIEETFEADAWFPDLDQDPEWIRAMRGEDMEWEGHIFHFDRYERVKP